MGGWVSSSIFKRWFNLIWFEKLELFDRMFRFSFNFIFLAINTKWREYHLRSVTNNFYLRKSVSLSIVGRGGGRVQEEWFERVAFASEGKTFDTNIKERGVGSFSLNSLSSLRQWLVLLSRFLLYKSMLNNACVKRMYYFHEFQLEFLVQAVSNWS